MSVYKKSVVVVVILAVASIAGLAYKVVLSDTSKQAQTVVLSSSVYKNDEYGFSFSYPSISKNSELNKDDEAAKILLRLQQQTSPEYLVTVRAETGLRLPSSLSRQDSLQLVVSGALAANPRRYTEYKLESDSTILIQNKPAHVIVFTYKSPAGALVKQQLLLFSNNSNSAVYIAMQFKESDFDTTNKEVFKNIVQSIVF